jgi:outer membrane protein OmpA-like peptidoglycan-associated protein
MRQQDGRGSSGERAPGASVAGREAAGGTPGKRSLVEQTYGHGAAPIQRRPAAKAAEPGGGSEDTANPSAADAGAADTEFPRVAAMVKNGTSAVALRGMLSADPSLAQDIPAYLVAGGDPKLNELMAVAFRAPASEQASSTATSSSEGGTKSEKHPTDPTQPLPAARTGNKALDKGVMKWTLKADDHQTANVDVDFKPDAAKVEAKNISYVQTVISKVGSGFAYGGGTATDPAKKKSAYQPFEEPTSKKRVDHFPGGENDPFYGAEWDPAAKKWKQERSSWKLGSSTKGGTPKSAILSDGPNAPESRMGLGDTASEFETVPVVLETREPLGALTWGFKIKDQVNSPIELTGGTEADCKDTPTADWGKTLDQFYAGKFDTILDDFDIAKADLKPDHKTKLDGIVAKMKADATLKAQLGGACDLTGDAKFNEELSLKRAENARAYLTSKGIDASRIEVQSYSFDWARVEAERGKSEGKNRRVQIWLHK